MNTWQPSFSTAVDVVEHLRRPYYRYDNRDKEATKVMFDDQVNLVWVGDSYGRVSSYDRNFQLYTRYTGHIGGTSVNDMLCHREGVISLSDESVHFSNRRGVTTMNLTSIDLSILTGLKSMCYNSSEKQSLVYCAGHNVNSGIVAIDLNKGCLESVVDYNYKAKLLCSNNKLVYIGKQSGSIDILDLKSNYIIKSFAGHSATISAMDARDYTLVTVGKSKRFHSTFADPFVNVYDIRTMQQLPPVPFSKGTTMGSGGPEFVKLHPVLSTIMLVACDQGAFDFVDLSNPTLRTQFVHSTSSVKKLSLSPNGDFMAFLNSDNTLNTWSRSNGNTNFTNTPEILEYPDFIDDGVSKKSISVNDFEYPLSSVGLPYYNEKLLSAWSPVVFHSNGTITKPIENSLLKNTTSKCTTNSKQNLAQNNLGSPIKEFPLLRYNKCKYGRRNVAEKYVCLKDIRKKINQNQNSGKPTLNSLNSTASIIGTEPVSQNIELLRYTPDRENEIPPAFSKLQLTHGRYGTDSFDFKSFNDSQYSGLDTDNDHPYINSIVQIYRFIPEIFNFISGCLKDENFSCNSLLTELGYLFDMLQRSKGRVCLSSNFQSTLDFIENNEHVQTEIYSKFKNNNVNLTTTPAIERLTLNSEDDCSQKFEDIEKSKVQKFNTFLISHLITEELQRTPHSIALEEALGLHLETTILSSCSHYDKKSSIVPTLIVTSPARNCSKQYNRKLNTQTILPYIESSMKRVKHIPNTCEVCNKQEVVEYEEMIRNLPPVLSLEILLSENEWTTVKGVKDWLTPEFFATISKDKVVLKYSPSELKTSNPIFRYEISGYVAKICDTTGESRLVTFSKIFDEKDQKFKWYMFNDYLVIEVEEEEALNASYWWKTIEVVTYCDSEELRKPFNSVDRYNIDYSILYRDHFANRIREDAVAQYKLLSQDEACDIPKPGTLVAIDAEFVILSEELSDIDCKGIKTIVKPKKTALARISVVRGEEGENFGVPFIDDYIVQTDHIENYVTKYSGINPGDLDLKNSNKQLVTRNVAYRKIWLLMQIGCVFVGHGLSNDFKQINLNVPHTQICDTAIYFLQGKRYLSLRYLAFALLDRNIQDGNHDSIEDAYTALILYKKYLNLKENGTLEHVLDIIYEEGRITNYKVPDEIK